MASDRQRIGHVVDAAALDVVVVATKRVLGLEWAQFVRVRVRHLGGF